MCSEIILRPYQFCNLTEVVVRASDDLAALQRKARLAAILGTFQASLVEGEILKAQLDLAEARRERSLAWAALRGQADLPPEPQPLADPGEAPANNSPVASWAHCDPRSAARRQRGIASAAVPSSM